MDNNELIIQALREGFKDRFAKQADEYEFMIANLRLQLTHVSTENEQLKKERDELNKSLLQYEKPAEPDSI